MSLKGYSKLTKKSCIIGERYIRVLNFNARAQIGKYGVFLPTGEAPKQVAFRVVGMRRIQYSAHSISNNRLPFQVKKNLIKLAILQTCQQDNLSIVLGTRINPILNSFLQCYLYITQNPSLISPENNAIC